jgi:hypothetical protein
VTVPESLGAVPSLPAPGTVTRTTRRRAVRPDTKTASSRVSLSFQRTPALS